MKKWLVRIVAVLAIIILLPIGAIVYSFAVTTPMADRKELSGGAVQIKDGFSSAGMIPSGPGQVILVDCGNDKAATSILAELKRQGLDKEAVKAVLITHGHPDHTNGCGIFSNAEIFAMASEQGLLEGTVGSRAPIGALMGKRNSGLHIARYLQDGESFQIGTQTISVYAVPGHTDGSAAYLVAGTLYLGDSADSGKDGKLHHAKRLASNDVEQNIASLKNLARRLAPVASQIKFLEFAHSGPFEGAGRLMDF